MPFLPRTCGTEIRGLVQTAFCGNLSLRSTDEKYEKASFLRGFCLPAKSWLRPWVGKPFYWRLLAEIYQAKKTASLYDAD